MPDPIVNTAEMLERVRAAVNASVVGHRAAVDDLLLCMVAGGHALLDAPTGIGKSFVARAIGAAFALRYARISMTSDVVPREVVGTRTVHVDERGQRHHETVKGPLFAQLVFVDEIEQGSPKTQALIFDAMQDGELVVGGERQSVDEPFVLLATHAAHDVQVAPLSASHRDRFLFEVQLARPDPVSVVAVLARSTGAEPQLPSAVASATALAAARAVSRTVTIRPRLLEWISDLLRALDPTDHDAHGRVRETLRTGPSVRGGQAIALAAKAHALMRGAVDVVYEDIERIVHPALRHRLVLTAEALTAGLTPDSVLGDVLPPPENDPSPMEHMTSLRPPPTAPD
jgi:MoxR-like ATPase